MARSAGYKTRSVEERFWENVCKLPGKDACWIWLGAVTPKTGYGVITEKIAPRVYRSIGTHRLSWRLAKKREPRKGRLICHTCDNRICVRPKHLYEGSHASNTQDMIARGRSKLRVGSTVETSTKGESHGMSKLTDAQVLQIREALKRKITHRQIAATYNVSHGTVTRINVGEGWRHV